MKSFSVFLNYLVLFLCAISFSHAQTFLEENRIPNQNDHLSSQNLSTVSKTFDKFLSRKSNSFIVGLIQYFKEQNTINKFEKSEISNLYEKTKEELIEYTKTLILNTHKSNNSKRRALFWDKIIKSVKSFFNRSPNLIKKTKNLLLEIVKVSYDEKGNQHIHMNQNIKGVNIWKKDVIAHVENTVKDNELTGNLITEDEDKVNLIPEISQLEALRIACKAYLASAKCTGAVVKEILEWDDKLITTFKVNLDLSNFEIPQLPVIFIDIITGDIIYKYNNLQTLLYRETYDAEKSLLTKKTLKRKEGDGPSGDEVVDKVHDNIKLIYDYFWRTFGRDGFDDAGSMFVTTVHFDKNYNNAFWSGTQFVFGDGDGVNFSPLVDFDVTAHEVSHAITEYESGLVYENESGALDEAISDIFAVCVDFDVNGKKIDDKKLWLIGEDSSTPGVEGDGIRRIDNPILYGNFDYYPNRYRGEEDNGGVHLNSGIANLAFSLLVKGGSHPRNVNSVKVPSIGMEKACNIFYIANRDYFTSGTTFEEAAVATKKAAIEKYGDGFESAAVSKAWVAVGVIDEISLKKKIENLSSEKGKSQYFTFDGSKASKVTISIHGGSGDADIYVKKDEEVGYKNFDCRPYLIGNDEKCVFLKGGIFNVMVYGVKKFSGVTLEFLSDHIE